MKILVVGSNGFLGTVATEYFSKKNEVLPVGITLEGENRLDATKRDEVFRIVENYKPDLIFDTVALTSSLKCEENPLLAKKLNYGTAKNLSDAALKVGAKIIFVSSSYVFDGKKGDYSEKDKPHPLNEYARTKVLAEKEILRNPRGIVIRVDIMYGYNGKNKPNGVFDRILSGGEIKIRDGNQLRQPIFVEDIPKASLKLASENQSGIFHLAGGKRIRMEDFLRSLEKTLRPESKIIYDSTTSKSNEIAVPKNATLNVNKAESVGIEFTLFEEGLKKISKKLRD